MASERKVVRLGRPGGVAGRSLVWEVRHTGRVSRVSRQWMRRGLRRGWLTGVEPVRRMDGDWGPLFGRPVYREVFGGTVEPRDHAKARARVRITRFVRGWKTLLLGSGVALGSGVFLSALVQPGLLLGAVLGVGAGLVRLRAAMAKRELDTLVDQLVPPVTPPPPPPEDWALEVAKDEVDAYLRGENTS